MARSRLVCETVDNVARRTLTARFKSAAIESAELDARLLVGPCARPRSDRHDHGSAAPTHLGRIEHASRNSRAVVSRASRSRAFSAQKEFWGLPLQLVGRDAGAAARYRDGGRTGAGNAARRWRPSIARCASPISAPAPAQFCWRCCPSCRRRTDSAPTSRVAALQTAGSQRGATAGLAERATFIACDYAIGLSGPFDLIVSNPPYIRSADIDGLAAEVREYDPPAALDGGADGLDAYRALIPQAAGLLAPGAVLVVEAGEGQSGRDRGFDGGCRVNACNRPQSRSGGHPEGRRGPQNAPIKSYWNAKKPLGIFPGSDYVPPTTSVQGCWPRRYVTGGGQSSRNESPPSERFQNAGPIERNSWSCAALDRKANESLILRLKTYARNRHAKPSRKTIGLVLAG